MPTIWNFLATVPVEEVVVGLHCPDCPDKDDDGKDDREQVVHLLAP